MLLSDDLKTFLTFVNKLSKMLERDSSFPSNFYETILLQFVDYIVHRFVYILQQYHVLIDIVR